jgi:hypothetical protein
VYFWWTEETLKTVHARMELDGRRTDEIHGSFAAIYFVWRLAAIADLNEQLTTTGN